MSTSDVRWRMAVEVARTYLVLMTRTVQAIVDPGSITFRESIGDAIVGATVAFKNLESAVLANPED